MPARISLWVCQFGPALVWSKAATNCVGSGSSWKGFWCSQYQMLPVTNLGIPVWSYQMICALWLPLLSLGTSEKEQAVYQGQLPTTSSLEATQQNSPVTLRSTYAYRLLCYLLRLPELLQEPSLKSLESGPSWPHLTVSFMRVNPAGQIHQESRGWV